MERELGEVTEKCKIDSELVQIEQILLVNGRLTQAYVKQVAQLCSDTKKLVDSGKEETHDHCRHTNPYNKLWPYTTAGRLAHCEKCGTAS